MVLNIYKYKNVLLECDEDMGKDLFSIELMKKAWMKCRSFNYADIRDFHLYSERDFYDKNINYILDDLRIKLKNGYMFHPKYMIPFPKKNGLIRRKVFLNLQDQIVTHAILEIIGYKIDKKFYCWSFGNRLERKRSIYLSNTFIHYVKQYNRFLRHLIYQLKNGYKNYCETDITSYFDHINHDILISQINSIIKDQNLDYIRDYLIPNFLKSPFIYNNKELTKNSGIPQGGAFSYFLSNVYLTEIDYEMSRFPNIKYLRYVDDIRILGKNYIDVERALIYLQERLSSLELELNSSKTSIKEINIDNDLKKFEEEQAEKLSHFNDIVVDKDKIYKLIDLQKQNEELLNDNNNFDELLKLRERKRTFAVNRLISHGVPTSFSFLKEIAKNRLDKVAYLLSHLNKFKHKVKEIEKFNEIFLNRPYEVIQGIALTNKFKWSKDFNFVDSYITSKFGQIELTLINNIELDRLYFSKIVKRVYFDLKKSNPFLIQTILYQFQKQSISDWIKVKFINEILKYKKYEEFDICIQLAALFKENRKIFDKVKHINKLEVENYLNFLRSNYPSFYNLLCNEDRAKPSVEVFPDKEFATLSEFMKNRIFSYREINKIMKDVINLVINSPIYLEKPHMINLLNIWVKQDEQDETIKVKLNPSPIEHVIFRTPEEILNKKDIYTELQASFLIGLIWISLYLKNLNDIQEYYQPYIEFNPKKFWINNNRLFKDSCSKTTLQKTKDYERFLNTLDTIRLLTRKNPKIRKNIRELRNEGGSLMTTAKSIEVFFSYSHSDESYRQQLIKHLSVMKRSGEINGWSDRDINVGEEWKEKINDKLNSAKVIILLISPDFLASDYCYEIEMRRALERHKSGEARVIPIILRPCDWQATPLGDLQALPTDGKPIELWDSKDSAFNEVTQGIRKAIRSMYQEV